MLGRTLAGAAAVLVLTTPAAHAATGAWDHIGTVTKPLAGDLVQAKRYAAFELRRSLLERTLARAPMEDARGTFTAAVRISLPRPDGRLDRFEVVESPVMQDGLAAAHPDIHTYSGRSVDDPTRTVRLALTALGLDASVRDQGGNYTVERRDDSSDVYASSWTRDGRSGLATEEQEPEDAEGPSAQAGAADPPPADGVVRRTYRLALVSDPTYGDHHRDASQPAGTGFRTTDAKVALVNRLTHIYEQEAAIRLQLIDGTDRLNLDTNALANQPGGACGDAACFPATINCFAGRAQNDRALGLLVGARAYDVGHLVLARQLGGVGYFESVGGPFKAHGCSGQYPARGDYLAGLVAHELGHQFDAHHTWSNCGSASFNTDPAAEAVEPGGGQTIMSYAGVCYSESTVQDSPDPYFSFASRAEMLSWVGRAPASHSSVQDLRLNGFEEGDSYRLAYGEGVSREITYAEHTAATGAATLQDVIEAIPGWPEGATATVTSIAADYLVVAFGGSLEGVPAEPLRIVEPAGLTSIAGERVAGGPATNGGTAEVLDNRMPTVTAPPAGTIPLRTPFALEAQGSDPDGDALTYQWEQTDDHRGPGFRTVLRQNYREQGPLFTAFPESRSATFAQRQDYSGAGTNTQGTSPVRVFPDVAQILRDRTSAATGFCAGSEYFISHLECAGEWLPNHEYVGSRGDRTIGFRVTARDHRPGGAGIAWDDTQVTIDAQAGPFRVTAPTGAVSVHAGGSIPVTWDVNGTDRLAPQVQARFSTDGGQVFRWPASFQTANDGFAAVTVPPFVETTTGVLQLKPVEGPWFDVARATITTRDVSVIPLTPHVDLGSKKVGKRSSTQTARIFNKGSVPAVIGSLAFRGDAAAAFEIRSDACSGRTLAPRASCEVGVRFTPGAAGPVWAHLDVPSSDPAAPVSVLVFGEGTG